MVFISYSRRHLKKAKWNELQPRIIISRSSRLDVFCAKGVLRDFTKFTGEHLCQCLFFNKVAGLRPATLLKKILWLRYFPVNFAKFLRTPFLTEHLRWLLLNIKLSILYLDKQTSEKLCCC